MLLILATMTIIYYIDTNRIIFKISIRHLFYDNTASCEQFCTLDNKCMMVVIYLDTIICTNYIPENSTVSMCVLKEDDDAFNNIYVKQKTDTIDVYEYQLDRNINPQFILNKIADGCELYRCGNYVAITNTCNTIDIFGKDIDHNYKKLGTIDGHFMRKK